VSIEPTLSIYEHYEQSCDMPTLASFERPRELQHWTVNETRIARAQDRVSDGRWSMQLDMFPSRWPGASLRPARDWSNYQQLVFDVWLSRVAVKGASENQTLDLIVKVSDAVHNGETHDRFEKTVRITASQKQTFRIRLSEIRAAPASRKMDLSHIVQLQFFTIRPKQPRTIWLDNIHLE